jgi:hypothetical protein
MRYRLASVLPPPLINCMGHPEALPVCNIPGSLGAFKRLSKQLGINGFKWSPQRRGTRTGTSQEPSPQGAFHSAPPHRTRCDRFGYTKSGFDSAECS